MQVASRERTPATTCGRGAGERRGGARRRSTIRREIATITIVSGRTCFVNQDVSRGRAPLRAEETARTVARARRGLRRRNDDRRGFTRGKCRMSGRRVGRRRICTLSDRQAARAMAGVRGSLRSCRRGRGASSIITLTYRSGRSGAGSAEGTMKKCGHSRRGERSQLCPNRMCIAPQPPPSAPPVSSRVAVPRNRRIPAMAGRCASFTARRSGREDAPGHNSTLRPSWAPRIFGPSRRRELARGAFERRKETPHVS